VKQQSQNRRVSFIATCNNIDPGKQVTKAIFVPGGMPPGTDPEKKE